MKQIIITVSLFISYVITAIYLRPSLSLISIIIASGLFCLLLVNLVSILKERNLFREENNYFMDNFQNIRKPVSLIKTPLENVYERCNSDIKNEISLAIQKINSLDMHLTNLKGIKSIHANHMDLAEYELKTFIKSRLDHLQLYADEYKINLQYSMNTDYASVWLDVARMSTILDNFVIYSIRSNKSGKHVSLAITSDDRYWSIKIFHPAESLSRQIRQKLSLLLYLNIGNSNGGALTGKFLNACNGKILIHKGDMELRFLLNNVEKETSIRLSESVDLDTQKTDSAESFNGIRYKLSNKPTVVIADDDEEFNHYLCKCLSEHYKIKSFSNGSAAYDYILQEYPDLIICDAHLSEMGGAELSSRLKTSNETSWIPIILLGSIIDEDERQNREFSMANLYMRKPLHPEDLKIEIKLLIKNSLNLRKSFLRRIFGDHFMDECASFEKDANCKFINKVKDIILNNLSEDSLNITFIADKLAISRTTLFNKLKSLTGEAPRDLIYRIRMMKARELLESGKHRVNEIPEIVGLKNVKNFRNRYKEFFGKTPKESIKKV